MTARRYNPTEAEIAALVAAGWRYTERTADEDAWFWPAGEYGADIGVCGTRRTCGIIQRTP